MSDNSLNPGINYFDNASKRVKFDGNCLKQEKVTFTHKKLVGVYTVCETNLMSFTVNQDFTLANSLFEAVTLTANDDIDNYKYFDYNIVFDANGSFLFSDGSEFDRNFARFGADMSSYVHIGNNEIYLDSW